MTRLENQHELCFRNQRNEYLKSRCSGQRFLPLVAAFLELLGSEHVSPPPGGIFLGQNKMDLAPGWVNWVVHGRRPFPSSPQPLFRDESKEEVFVMNQFSFELKLELIVITKISQLDFLWRRD